MPLHQGERGCEDARQSQRPGNLVLRFGQVSAQTMLQVVEKAVAVAQNAQSLPTAVGLPVRHGNPAWPVLQASPCDGTEALKRQSYSPFVSTNPLNIELGLWVWRNK